MKEYIFTVKGMRCGMCESHIDDVVRRAGNVKSVKSNRNKNQTVVVAEELDVEKIKAAVRAVGYEVGDAVEEREYKKRGLFGLFG